MGRSCQTMSGNVTVNTLLLVFLSSTDVLNNISLKLGWLPIYVYVFSGVFFLFPLVVINFHRIFSVNDTLFFCIFLCLILGFSIFYTFNGYADSPDKSIGVLISSISFLAVFFIYKDRSYFELIYTLRLFVIFTAVLYCFIDILSVVFMGKSQHVLLSNLLPLFFIFLIFTKVFGQHEDMKGIGAAVFGILLWTCISALQFTSDGRFQVKVFIYIFLFFIYYLFFIPLVGRVFISRRAFLICVYFVLFLLSASTLVFYSQYGAQFALAVDREGSYTLRQTVFYLFLDEMSLKEYIYGFGFGTSYKEFVLDYNGWDVALKSHSGWLSVFYEMGFIGIFSTFIFLLYFIGVLGKNNSTDYGLGKISILNSSVGKIRSVFLLFLCYFFMNNVVYMYSLPFPNFAEQVQYPMVIILFILFRKFV